MSYKLRKFIIQSVFFIAENISLLLNILKKKKPNILTIFVLWINTTYENI